VLAAPVVRPKSIVPPTSLGMANCVTASPKYLGEALTPAYRAFGRLLPVAPSPWELPEPRGRQLTHRCS
jgi:hypothetical protein